MDAKLSFGAWLQRRRKGLDLTQAELAEQVGYARVTIHKVETDQLRASRQMADKLAEALAIAPAEREAFRRFARDGPHGDLASALPPLAVHVPIPASRRRHNLPVPATRLIGREEEVQAGCTLLRADVRLLTLTGAGGMGKTRLALAIAAALIETFPDGVWFVDLAALGNAASVLPAVAAALGVRDHPGRPLRAALLAALRDRTLLLLLDNCEHLVDACARLSEELLGAAPNLRILATSREALRIAGEVSRGVPPLALPLDAENTPDGLLRAAAVRLFIERAVAVRPSFAVTGESAAALAQVCRRLDGMPLALELAAARMGALSVQQIADRLDDRFRLLTGGSRSALPRQQTLRATIDWSYDLLAARDRLLLQRLAVFAGGWTLEAAEAVGAGEGLAAPDVPGSLFALVDQSLVTVEDQGEAPRYRLLETLRQYAGERLRDAGAAPAAQRRHLAWCVALAERSDPERPGTAQRPGLGQLAAEHANLSAALAWALEHDAASGLRLAGALGEYWRRAGRHADGRRWLRAVSAAANPTGVPLGARARALLAAGQLAADAGECGPEHVAQAQESVQIFRDAGDRRGLAAALQHLGRCVLEAGGETEQVRPHFDESLHLARTVGDSHWIGFALANLAYLVWLQGDRRQALAWFEEAVAHVRRSGDVLFTGLLLGTLGWYTMADGDAERARRYQEEGLAILRGLSAGEAIGLALLALAQLARREGDSARQRKLLEESVVLLRETGSPGLADWLCFVGQGQVERGEYARGVRLLAAGESDGPRFGSLRALLYQMPRDELETRLALARSALGDEAFATAWAEGKALTPDEAVACALDSAEERRSDRR